MNTEEPLRRDAILILMPGLDGTGLLFDRFIAALPEGLATRVVRYPTDRPLSLDEHVAVVQQAIGNDRVVLLAESFSGLVALQLLRRGGSKVEKVIFVASFAAPPRGYLKPFAGLLPLLARGIALLPDALWRRFCLGPGASPQAIRWLKGVVAKVDPTVIAQRLRLVAMTTFPPGAPLPVPAFYLQARADKLVPPRAGAALRALFARFTLIPVAGPHFVLQANPGECAAQVAAIVRGAEHRGAPGVRPTTE